MPGRMNRPHHSASLLNGVLASAAALACMVERAAVVLVQAGDDLEQQRGPSGADLAANRQLVPLPAASIRYHQGLGLGLLEGDETICCCMHAEAKLKVPLSL